MTGGRSFPERRWIALTLIIWLLTCTFLVSYRWPQIYWFALGDTDDNMRMMQVRAWLDGQPWFDLRQYRLAPPTGANIHWSRLPDLPIAMILLLLKPLFGIAIAERAAAAAAPLIPLLIAIFGVAITARWLIAPLSFALAAALLVSAQSAMGMFAPLRIDHHGWQLAALSFVLAGLVDPDRRRGGLTVGAASAISLIIGLEMMLYLALAGAVIALRWIWSREEATRLQPYGIVLAGGSALGYLLFASYDNARAVCDALSPVWVSTMALGGGMLTALGWIRSDKRLLRLAVAGVAGAILAVFFILAWPQCLGRPEGVSPELQRMWLDNIREAKPIYAQDWKLAAAILSVPVISLFGTLAALWNNRHTPDAFAAWAGAATLSFAAFALLILQTRAGPGAQLLAIPGCAYLAWLILPRIRANANMLIRTFGTVAVFLLASGLFIPFAAKLIPEKTETSSGKAVRRAGAACSTIPAMKPLDKFPRSTVMTMNDLGPRLITLTHHNAISGPYHRNGEAILDLHHAFGGTPETAYAVAKKYRAGLLLICPGFAESTVYKARSAKGFYAQLENGTRFDWLEPVEMPKGSPFRLWRIR